MEEPKQTLHGTLSVQKYQEAIRKLLGLKAQIDAGGDPQLISIEMIIAMLNFFESDPLVQQKQITQPVHSMITAILNIIEGVPASHFFKSANGRPRHERTTLRPCSAVLVDRFHAVGMPIREAYSSVAKTYRRTGVLQRGASDKGVITASQIGLWHRALQSHKDDREAPIYRRLSKQMPAPTTLAEVQALADEYAAGLARIQARPGGR